jgi:hypothetical protein
MTTTATLENPLPGASAAAWLDSVTRRIGVERQRLSRLEGKINGLRPGALRNDRKENAEYETAVNEAAIIELKLSRLEAEERAARGAVEKEQNAGADAAKKIQRQKIEAIGAKARECCVNIDAALATAGAEMEKLRAFVRDMGDTAAGLKMHTRPSMVAAGVEGALPVAVARHLGGHMRGPVGLMTEKQLQASTFDALAGGAIAAFLYHPDA